MHLQSGPMRRRGMVVWWLVQLNEASDRLPSKRGRLLDLELDGSETSSDNNQAICYTVPRALIVHIGYRNVPTRT